AGADSTYGRAALGVMEPDGRGSRTRRLDCDSRPARPLPQPADMRSVQSPTECEAGSDMVTEGLIGDRGASAARPASGCRGSDSRRMEGACSGGSRRLTRRIGSESMESVASAAQVQLPTSWLRIRT